MTEVTAEATSAREGNIRPPNPYLEFFSRLFREKPLGAIGAVVCLIFLFAGIFADVLAPYGFNQIMPINRMKPPSWQFWFGTDNLGRDIFSRVLYGARLSVIIGLSAALLATIISVALGIITGYLGGKVDMLIQRFVDAWMSFPDIVILIVVVAVVGPGMPQVIGILGCLYGIAGSRIIRSAVLQVREQSYIHAAQSIGGGTPRILLAACPAERDAAGDRAVHHPRRRGHPRGGGAVVPRPRRAAAGADLGRNAHRQRAQLHVSRAVDGARAGHLPDARCLQHQHVRRRAARSARSAHARPSLSFTNW
jgi:hypothetical protein